MEITMNTSTEKIKTELTAKLKNIFGDPIPKDKIDIVRKYIDAYFKNKTNNYYNTHVPFLKIVEAFKKASADSKAEIIFYDLLTKNKIPFKFQYKIDPYRVDFLISDWLVFEIDGPLHHREYDQKRDKYIKKMGYEVMRVALSILVISPELVIDEIKERILAHA